MKGGPGFSYVIYDDSLELIRIYRGPLTVSFEIWIS